MDQYILFFILGLSGGAIATFIGLGVLVGYKGSGVLNFAQGATAMYVAYEYYDLRVNGLYFFPIPGLPASVQVGRAGTVGTPEAIAISLATAVVLGVLSQILIFRPLRRAPTLAKVVASVGLLLILDSIVELRFNTEPVSVPEMEPSGTAFRLFGANIPQDRVFLVIAVIIVGAVLWALFRFTRFGLATRASTENERGAILLGMSPEFQAGVCWVLAALLAGLGGILVSPITTLTPSGFTLIIIPALAAVLVARFKSFSLTVVAGLVIGMVDSLLTNLPAEVHWFPVIGMDDVFQAVLIIGIIFGFGKSVPTRGMLTEARLPAAPVARRPALYGTVAVAVTVILLLVLPVGYRVATINSLIGVLVCLSLVVLVGFVGQISLFQMVLAGAGAYILSDLATNFGIPFPLSPLLAALFVAAVGLVVAVPALRVRGVSLAVLTFAVGWAIEEVWFNNTSFNGGFAGATVPHPSLFGIDLAFTKGTDVGTMAFSIMLLVVVVLVGFAVVNLRRSDTGRRMLAVRSNERAAAAAGIHVARTKFIAFGISAFIAGLAGTLLAYQQLTLSPSTFDVLVSVSFLAVAYLGGISSVAGAAVGGTLATGGLGFYIIDVLVLNHVTNGLDLQGAVAGVGLILTAILNQEGVAGALRDQLARLRPSRKASPAPPAAAIPAGVSPPSRLPVGDGAPS